MSVKYIPVQWNPNKWKYDGILLAAVVSYLAIFLYFGRQGVENPPDQWVLRMRAFGSCAFLMLTIILMIGPLARLDSRFLPWLYNRRHFGVMTFVVAFTHATYVMGWYFAFSPTPRFEALLISNTSYGQLLGFPIEPLGITALIILAILAATSHDFWLSFLSAPVWKALHLLIYVAYGSVVAHVALGYLQTSKHPAFAIMFASGALGVALLHLAAWWKMRENLKIQEGWVAAGKPERIRDKRAKMVKLPNGQWAAVFRNKNSFSAVSNVCAHQGGPLGEGKILYGNVTCPWHGFSYKAHNGCSPPPFTEKIPTYGIKLVDGILYVAPEANEPGTEVPPIIVEGLTNG